MLSQHIRGISVTIRQNIDLVQKVLRQHKSGIYAMVRQNIGFSVTVA